MSWATPQLMAWIERVEARAATATMFELLEVASSADNEAISSAFRRIAGGAHPDLHRRGLSPTDAERLVRAYGKVAAAYSMLRDPAARQRYRKELADRGRPAPPPPVVGGSQSVAVQRPVSAAAALAGRTGAVTSLGLGIGATATPIASRPHTPSPPPAVSRTTTPGTRPPITRAQTSPPVGTRAPTSPPVIARTTTPPAIGRATTPPAVGRATTPPSVGRTTTPPAVGRTPTPSPPPEPISRGRTTTGPRSTRPSPAPTTPTARAATAPPADRRAPLITPPPDRPGSRSDPPPTTTRPPPSSTLRPRGDSRPPTGGIGPRAQVYYRKAQSCLADGDLGGAVFNLRLAAAADPRSSLIRVALAEVEGEMSGKK